MVSTLRARGCVSRCAVKTIVAEVRNFFFLILMCLWAMLLTYSSWPCLGPYRERHNSILGAHDIPFLFGSIFVLSRAPNYFCSRCNQRHARGQKKYSAFCFWAAPEYFGHNFSTQGRNTCTQEVESNIWKTWKKSILLEQMIRKCCKMSGKVSLAKVQEKKQIRSERDSFHAIPCAINTLCKPFLSFHNIPCARTQKLIVLSRQHISTDRYLLALKSLALLLSLCNRNVK